MIFLKRGDLMGKRPPQFLWLEVTKDEYEFPIYIADTAEELAKLTGVKSGTSVISAMYHARKHKYWCKYKKVPF